MSVEHKDGESAQTHVPPPKSSGGMIGTIVMGVVMFIIFSVLAEFGCAPRNLRD
jgi:hypothetical protein